MSRKLVAAVLPLALLVVVSPKKSFAAPPEKVGSAMTFDTVADGLRKYRQETDPAKRAALLERLAPTCDPRVAIVLAEALKQDPEPEVRHASFVALTAHFLHLPKQLGAVDDSSRLVLAWWKTHEQDVRRRAAKLPL